MTAKKMTAGGICQKLAEANSILILANNDLGMEIEAGNDHIGLNVYKRALDTAIDLIRPCYDSLSEYQETAPMPKPGNPEPAAKAIAIPNETIKELEAKTWELQKAFFAVEAVLSCASETMGDCGPKNIMDAKGAIEGAVLMIRQWGGFLELQINDPLEAMVKQSNH